MNKYTGQVTPILRNGRQQYRLRIFRPSGSVAIEQHYLSEAEANQEMARLVNQRNAQLESRTLPEYTQEERMLNRTYNPSQMNLPSTRMDRSQFCQKLKEYLDDEDKTEGKYQNFAKEAHESGIISDNTEADIFSVAAQEYGHYLFFKGLYDRACSGKQ